MEADLREALLKEIVAWVAQLPPGAEATLATMRDEEARIRALVDDVTDQLRKIQQQIAMVEEALELRRFAVDSDSGVGTEQASVAVNGRTPARGREAVMALLNQHPPEREWAIAEVVKELADRGWAKPDDDHAVSVSLSRLFRAGKVYRPRKGVYTLAPPTEIDASAEAQQGFGSVGTAPGVWEKDPVEVGARQA
jgi:AcrR family transcriptional regulator